VIIRPQIGQSEAVKPFAAKIVQSVGSLILPLPPHSVHLAAYIFRPGWVGCFTSDRPVPLHASHLCSSATVPLIEITPYTIKIQRQWSRRDPRPRPRSHRRQARRLVHNAKIMA
jgi:hypothetical protein